jgi:2-oxo-4-hydroxy-4-carboxy-5-ureidoimidazoline decarboxylase
MTIGKINSLSARDAVTLFRRCCGSKQWAEQMKSRRPFRDLQQLCSVADEIWGALSVEDWKEAFARHPRIGDIKELRKRFADTAGRAEGEQAGAAGASEKTLKALYESNNLYEAKFGYIFIVCATGKSAEAMLLLLNSRLNNLPAEEITVAAEEQAKITKLRLEKILHDV